MPEYEIRVAGPIGRVVAAGLPGFSSTAAPTATLLCTVGGPEELRRFLYRLEAHGLPALDIQIGPR